MYIYAYVWHTYAYICLYIQIHTWIYLVYLHACLFPIFFVYLICRYTYECIIPCRYLNNKILTNWFFFPKLHVSDFHTRINIYMYMHMYIYVFIYVCKCMYIRIYIYSCEYIIHVDIDLNTFLLYVERRSTPLYVYTNIYICSYV